MKMCAVGTMDSPVSIILSELTSKFALGPSNICTLLCTCKRAASCVFDRSQFVVKTVSRSTGYAFVSGIFVGTYYIVNGRNTVAVYRSDIQVAVLSRQKFMYFTTHSAAGQHTHTFARAQPAIRKLFRESIITTISVDMFSPGAEVAYVVGDFYLLTPPLREIFRDHKKLRKYLIRLRIYSRG